MSDNELDQEDRQLQEKRMVEAILFASHQPLAVKDIEVRLDEGVDVKTHIEALVEDYAKRGLNLVEVAGRWAFRTAADLSFLLRDEVEELRKLSRAGVETLAIIAYHQPITRAEIEELRGVSLSKGTLDVLMEAGWVRPAGRKQTPGRPVLYGTTEEFLVHFGLGQISDLPGMDELKASGMLDPVDDVLDNLLKDSAALDAQEQVEEEDSDELPLT
ncbi:MAG: SMC-Scp complex subunit ScpB [Sphingomonadales bacterium]|jgi:segregation and condensation protein B